MSKHSIELKKIALKAESLGIHVKYLQRQAERRFDASTAMPFYTSMTEEQAEKMSRWIKQLIREKETKISTSTKKEF